VRLALTIDDTTDDAGHDFDAATARYLADVASAEVLLLRADARSAGFVGTARLRLVETGGERQLAMIERVQRFASELSVTLPMLVPRLQLLDQEQFDRIVLRASLLSDSHPCNAAGFREAQAGFLAAPADLARFREVAHTLWAETGGRCALTGALLAADIMPVVICPMGADKGLHVNNLLLLSPEAEAAFQAGHFSARDDFSLLFDAAKIDPELQDRSNPIGRLFVATNPALCPAPENLAWHRRFIFGLD
jgi:hypothetical protein